MVEDEQAQMELIKLNLEDSDPSLIIYTTASPSKALTIIKKEPIECVVSDYQLPEMNGIQLCREIRTFSSVPFIIYTGRGSEEVALTAFSAGVDDYVRKEKELAHFKVLANGIRSAVERSRTEKASVRAEEELRSSQEKLRSANEELLAMEDELRSSNEQLTIYSTHLEEMVEERTREMREAEERLRQSSLYARSLIEASPDPLVTISAEGKITDVNEATVQVTGVSRERLIGSDFSGYFTEPEKAEAGYLQVFREGNVRDYPLSIRHASGEVRDVLYNAALYTNQVGEVQGVFAAARDITQRKLLEDRLRAFMDSLSDPFNIWDRDLNLIDTNKAILNWFPPGTKREDIIGKNIRELAPGIEETERFAKFMHVMKSGEPTILHNVMSMTGYGDRRYDVKVFRLREGIGAINFDVTERGRAEERLRESSNYARSLIETSLDPLITINSEGKITDVNEATVRVTGVTRERLIGSDFSGYFTEPVKAEVGYMQVFREGNVRDYPLSIRHASGEVRDVLYNAALYTNQVGEVQGVFAAARDVTERNRLEAQHRLDEKRIRHSEQMEAVSRMGATVAHDLRGPLGVIVQSVNVAKQDPQRTQRMLQLIEDSAVRSLSMIANWRSSTREISLQPQETSLANLVGKVVEGMSIPSNIKVAMKLENLGVIRLDPDVTHRVIDNIVKNAVEAMPDGGRLTISGVRGPDYVSLSISDTGVGIPKEIGDEVFTPLFTTKSGGMGLGLNYCRRAVEAHGGSIEYESEVNKGTTFTVKLPSGGAQVKESGSGS